MATYYRYKCKISNIIPIRSPLLQHFQTFSFNPPFSSFPKSYAVYFHLPVQAEFSGIVQNLPPAYLYLSLYASFYLMSSYCFKVIFDNSKIYLRIKSSKIFCCNFSIFQFQWCFLRITFYYY